MPISILVWALLTVALAALCFYLLDQMERLKDALSYQAKVLDKYSHQIYLVDVAVNNLANSIAVLSTYVVTQDALNKPAPNETHVE